MVDALEGAAADWGVPNLFLVKVRVRVRVRVANPNPNPNQVPNLFLGTIVIPIVGPSSRLTRRPPWPAATLHGHPCHSHGPARFPSS
jgi:hypothetical protein